MSTKLIIYCPGRPNMNGHARRRFLWNVEFNCYVYENKVLDERELNAVVDTVFKKNSDLRPCVRVVKFSDEAGAPPVDPDPTLEQALEIVRAHAPDRLKKTPGPKPAAMEV